MRVVIDHRGLTSSLGKIINGMRAQGRKADAMVSYDTYYAVLVHEDLTPKNWQRPGSGPKYLEGPAYQMASDGSLIREVHRSLSVGETLPQAILSGARLLRQRSLSVCPIDTQDLYNSCKATLIR